MERSIPQWSFFLYPQLSWLIQIPCGVSFSPAEYQPSPAEFVFPQQLRRYIPDPSHVVQVDDVQVRDNLNVETSPMRIEDRELKQLRGKEIALVKVAWGGPAGGNVTWELESQMKESYPELFA
ncbi:hypothetical protein KIW84_013689 [Lathyrus oleraceus]|uniref:Retrotransposon gag protein n=1 Tax=Pisum sativum TaxID=3888 RepID=A0A9D5BL39_PEA|nr:hypothetical protein KIW84_013689 [Pisum sativum]